jgi:hypothetical protein
VTIRLFVVMGLEGEGRAASVWAFKPPPVSIRANASDTG